jgi:hypothetical protein
MPPLDPFTLGSEVVYTTLIVVLCIAIYWRTRDLYLLSKHPGIKHFRDTFLFFGIAYFTSFLLQLVFLTGFTFRLFIPGHFVVPLFIVPVSYFSTLALLSLMYSVVWKRMKSSRFLILANTVAIAISVVGFILHQPFIISLVQLCILMFVLLLVIMRHQLSTMRLLYLLVAVFWLISLFILGPNHMVHPGVTIALQAVSLTVFFILWYKTSKWTP